MKNSDYQLSIIANSNSPVLERIMQVTRYRGFDVVNFHVCRNDAKDCYIISLFVSSDTPIVNLKHQLSKLADIIKISTNNTNNHISDTPKKAY